MRALVIGGNGFIGAHLVNLLDAEGVDVRVFDLYPSKFFAQKRNIEYVTGDLGTARDEGILSKIVHDVDWVFHLASSTLPKTSNDDPIYDVSSNLINTLQLLQECTKAKVEKIVFVSSGGTVYGAPRSVPITESHPTEPICSYGITKLAIEKYLHLFYHLEGLDYAVARLSNPYGEGQNPNAKQGAIGVFLGRIARGEEIEIWGDGEVIRDYIYIRDAVAALVDAARHKASATEPRVFNIGSGVGHSLNDIIDEIRSVVDVNFKVHYDPARALDVSTNILDNRLAGKHLGWHPTTDLKTGIERTWNWIQTLDAQAIATPKFQNILKA